eukprot:GEMP01039037.1.p1 GENE.GEMP01039037.1~~GEMP01039037.1.p1  ORF type:complete len:480 (+),score=104.83 GEMP01039037.1:24-1442(+)
MERQVVVDAGAAIRLKQLDRFGKELFTTSGILSEVREKTARMMLSYLPCELKVKQPTAQDVAFVRAFAKKTGDLGFLSQNDIDVIALTVMLQRESGEVAHLRTSPRLTAVDKAPQQFAWVPEKDVDVATKNLASLAISPSGADSAVSSDARAPSSVEQTIEQCVAREQTDDCDSKETRHVASDESAATCLENVLSEVKEDPGTDSNDEADAGCVENALSEVKVDPWTESMTEEAGLELMGEQDGEDDEELSLDGSDAGDWVTSENIGRFNMSVESQDEGKVACVTTDYSVQNVLMQIGLRVLSIDGYRIRNLKLWGLLCRACGHSTRDTTKMWCPKCGHATVDRVPITLDSETGQMTIHDNRRRIKTRGLRYSIPAPKGGRHNRGPIFAEDELMIGGRMQEIRRAQKLLEREKLAHDPFADKTGNANQWCSRHVTASGNHINQFEAKVVVGYGRRNPNANNFSKHTGNKKKR